MNKNNLKISLNNEQTRKFLSVFLQEAIIIAKERDIQKEETHALTFSK